MTKRRNFSDKFTAAMALEALRGNKTVQVIAANVTIGALLGTIGWLGGWDVLLFVFLPAMFLAAIVGMWLFYVQHQFEETDWSTGKTGMCRAPPSRGVRITICPGFCVG